MADDEENIKSIDEENIIFRNFMDKKELKLKCQICDSKNFKYWIKANPILLPIIDTKENKVGFSHGAQVYWVQCDNCFNILFFHKPPIVYYLNDDDINNHIKKDNTENQ